MPAIERHPRVNSLKHVNNIRDLELAVAGEYGHVATNPEKFDLVMLCGWSWQVSERLLNKATVVSEHPACDDRYSLGTPLQNQILDGIKHTSHRVVKIGYPELSQRLYSPSHEVQMNLTGNMDDILSEMESTARTIYTRFLDDYPNVNWAQWDMSEDYATPRTPHDSLISKHDMSILSVKALYDRMRMLEAPYPNAHIEDEDGVLYFERVRYKSKK